MTFIRSAILAVAVVAAIVVPAAMPESTVALPQVVPFAHCAIPGCPHKTVRFGYCQDHCRPGPHGWSHFFRTGEWPEDNEHAPVDLRHRARC